MLHAFNFWKWLCVKVQVTAIAIYWFSYIVKSWLCLRIYSTMLGLWDGPWDEKNVCCIKYPTLLLIFCDQSMFKFLIHSLRCNVLWLCAVVTTVMRMKIPACSVHTAMVINVCTERIDHAYGCTDIQSWSIRTSTTFSSTEHCQQPLA